MCLVIKASFRHLMFSIIKTHVSTFLLARGIRFVLARFSCFPTVEQFTSCFRDCFVISRQVLTAKNVFKYFKQWYNQWLCKVLVNEIESPSKQRLLLSLKQFFHWPWFWNWFCNGNECGESLLNQLFDSCSRPKRREQRHLDPI